MSTISLSIVSTVLVFRSLSKQVEHKIECYEPTQDIRDGIVEFIEWYE